MKKSLISLAFIFFIFHNAHSQIARIKRLPVTVCDTCITAEEIIQDICNQISSKTSTRFSFRLESPLPFSNATYQIRCRNITFDNVLRAFLMYNGCKYSINRHHVIVIKKLRQEENINYDF